jgi:hypothetical protein
VAYGDVPVDAQLDLPELLYAFVPFAHVESGIRQELTDEAERDGHFDDDEDDERPV